MINLKRYFLGIVKEYDDEEYLKIKERYDKDQRFYSEYSNIVDHTPAKLNFKATRNIEMAKEGKELLEWYKKF